MPLLPLCSAALVLQAPQPSREQLFRQWLGAEEVGQIRVVTTDRLWERDETVGMLRAGQRSRQRSIQRVQRDPAGRLTFTWRLELGQEAHAGSATWDPAQPRVIQWQGPTARTVEVPEGAHPWPPDQEARIRESALQRTPFRSWTFDPLAGTWRAADFIPAGAAPLPGHPDTWRFTLVGGDTEAWISPAQGQLRTVTNLLGQRLVIQRANLPPLAPQGGSPFAGTRHPLPFHPLAAWLTELEVTGPFQGLPADPQQTILDKGLRLRIAPTPSPLEATQPPVERTPSPEEAPDLAATPLVQHGDPCFRRLALRLRPAPGASRWDLARQVCRFVFEEIQQKDLNSGFATALEVCRRPSGDCSEHTVLAVGLLRHLGVPSRAAFGWAAREGAWGLHQWVEVRLRERWIPVDPTWDQAPAGTLRVRAVSSSLEDLSTVLGLLAGLRAAPWEPRPAWNSLSMPRPDRLSGPGTPDLILEGGRWSPMKDRLVAHLLGRSFKVEAAPRPDPAHLQGWTLMRSALAPGLAYVDPSGPRAWVQLETDRWLHLEGVDPDLVVEVLRRLRIEPPSSR